MHVSNYNEIVQLNSDLYVVANLLSGAVDVVPRIVVKLLNDLQDFGDSSSLGKEQLIETLKERGYIFESVEEEELEFARLGKIHANFFSNCVPLSFKLIFSYNCNLRCVYCFQKAVQSQYPQMSKDRLEKAFDAMMYLDNNTDEDRPRPNISVFGGEPLLEENRYLIENTYELANKAGFVPGSILTNGLLLKEFVPLLEEKCVKQIQVGLDGPREVHDQRRPTATGGSSFDRIAEGIDEALDSGISVTARVHVDDQNIDSLPRLASWIKMKGWSAKSTFQAYVAPVDGHKCSLNKPNLVNPMLLAKILDNLNTHKEMSILKLTGWEPLDYFIPMVKSSRPTIPRFVHCDAFTGNTFYFDNSGDVYICIECCGYPTKAVGSFIPGLHFNERYVEWRDRNIAMIPQCSSCSIALICGGGCGFSALERSGTIMQPDCGGARECLKLYMKHEFAE
jgi:uncharacterized protein